MREEALTSSTIFEAYRYFMGQAELLRHKVGQAQNS